MKDIKIKEKEGKKPYSFLCLPSFSGMWVVWVTGLSLSLRILLYASVGWGWLDRWTPPPSLFTYCCGIKISDCLSARLLQKPQASRQFMDGWTDEWMDGWI